MARLRTIKPGFFENEELAECSPYARLMFIGLWCHADRRGILADRPKRLKLSILPADDVSGTELIKELDDHGLILRYEVDGQKCILIPNFQKHQHPHKDEQPNELPVPESMIDVSYKHGASTVQASVKPDATPALTLTRTSKKEITNVISKENAVIERQTRLNPNWQPNESEIEYAKKVGVPNVEVEVIEFVDYYVSKGTKFTDWHRTWQRWCRDPNGFRRRAASNGKTPHSIPEIKTVNPY